MFLTLSTGEEGDLLPRVLFFRVVLSDDKTHDNRDEWWETCNRTDDYPCHHGNWERRQAVWGEKGENIQLFCIPWLTEVQTTNGLDLGFV